MNDNWLMWRGLEILFRIEKSRNFAVKNGSSQRNALSDAVRHQPTSTTTAYSPVYNLFKAGLIALQDTNLHLDSNI